MPAMLFPCVLTHKIRFDQDVPESELSIHGQPDAEARYDSQNLEIIVPIPLVPINIQSFRFQAASSPETGASGTLETVEWFNNKTSHHCKMRKSS
jgi:hypothetical protein